MRTSSGKKEIEFSLKEISKNFRKVGYIKTTVGMFDVVQSLETSRYYTGESVTEENPFGYPDEYVAAETPELLSKLMAKKGYICGPVFLDKKGS